VSARAAAVAGLLALASVTPARAQDGVGFRAALNADTVYVGEQVTYQLTVTIPSAVRQRLRRNPEFVPPDARAMLVYDLPVPRTPPGGEGPEVHVFRRAIFPLTRGRYDIQSARLTFSLPQSPSFFSREEERTLRSEAVSFVAIDPPAGGRPADWTGAVGRWRASARVDASGSRVGDPFVLTLRVEGTGNATLLPRPPIEIPWANVVTEDERVVLDSTPTTLGGAKEFTWLVTPREAGLLQVPTLAYAYFDPVARRYEVARTAPVAIRVREGDLVTIPPRALDPGARAALPIHPALVGPSRVALPWPWVWAWLAFLAPLPWVAARWRERRPRPVRERAPEERLRDARVGDAGSVRTLFDAALVRRTGVAPTALTGPGALATALRREGVTPETAGEAERLRDRLDAAAYAGGESPAGLREAARSLLRRIDDQARRRTSVALLLLAGLVASCATVPPPSPEAFAAFSEGQTAYAGADYARARDAFLRAANAAPRDRAAWSNLGTAAWQAGDTAAAVLGWQRALRLDPDNGDLRARLGRVRAPQSRGPARVWPIPVLPVAALAFALWCAGWAWSAARRWRHRTARRALLLLGPAVPLAALAAYGEWQARARDLVVVSATTSLRSLPALGAEPGAVPLIGEVVRVRERRGVWLRIELDAGRSGWYPAESTYPLARR
jgi:tetratricopeptide (TPR) repeat protein